MAASDDPPSNVALNLKSENSEAVSTVRPSALHRARSVVFLTPWFPNRPGDRNGAYIYDSAIAAKRAGLAVSVVVCRPAFPAVLDRWAPESMRGEIDTDAFSKQFDGFAVVRFPAFPRGLFRQITNRGQRSAVTPVLEALTREQHASVIHAQTEGVAPIAVDVAHAFGIPSVVTIHGLNMNSGYLHAPSQKALLSKALAGSDRLILVGEPLREVFAAYAGRGDHIRVVPNGVRLPTTARRLPVLSSDTLRLISVSNLNEGKGIDLTLDALAQLDARGLKNWSYAIIGDGPERPALRERVEKLGLKDRVIFEGAREPDFVYERLLSADVFVLPSYREAFGIAYLEAMASGLVAIGIIGQGPEAFIESGKAGFLVAPHDSSAIADCILHIKSHPDEARGISERASQVSKGFTWDAHARRLRDVYDEALTSRAA